VLKLCNEPLNEGFHPDAFVNIETEKVIIYSAIIIDNIFAIGKATMQELEENSKNGFNKILHDILCFFLIY